MATLNIPQGTEKFNLNKHLIENLQNMNTDLTNFNLSLNDISKLGNDNTDVLLNSLINIDDYLGITALTPVNSALCTKLTEYKYKYVRVVFTWSTLEKAQGVYDFTTSAGLNSAYYPGQSADEVINNLVNAGLIPLVVFSCYNTVYNSDYNKQGSDTNNLTGFKNFVLAVATRYKNKNIIYSILNEPNYSAEFGTGTAADYVNLPKNAYSAIKYADPTAKVVAPTISTDITHRYLIVSWFESACQNGLLDYLDYVSLNSYNDYPATNKPEELITIYNNIKAIIKKYTNKDIPLIVTETGYTTDTRPEITLAKTTEEIRKKFLPRTLFVNLMSGISKTFVYDAVIKVSTSLYGIFNVDLSATDTANNIKNLFSPLLGFYYAGRVKSANDDYILKFVNDKYEFKYAVWTTNATQHNIKLNGNDVMLSDTPVIIDTNEKLSISISKEVFSDMTTVGGLGEVYNNILKNIAKGQYSHAEGNNNIADGDNSHVEGYFTFAGGDGHAEGAYTIAYSGDVYKITSVDVNNKTLTLDNVTSLAVNDVVPCIEDWYLPTYATITAINGNVVTINITPKATWKYLVKANVQYYAPHVEGVLNKCLSGMGHVEGYNNTLLAHYGHIEGSSNKIEVGANNGHIEGLSNLVTAPNGHSEGESTKCNAIAGHSEGEGTSVDNFAGHASGKYNKIMTSGGGYSTQIGDVFVIGNGTGAGALSNAFRVTYTGQILGTQAYTASGADYAEYFEWLDGNINNENRRGYLVTLEGNKIKLANNGDYILGIVSANPCIIGNGDEDWLGRWERDEFGGFILEDVTLEDGTIIKNGRLKPNPNYDVNQVYIPREQRKEWSLVGMLGVIAVRDDGTCTVNGFCKVNSGIATSSARGIDTYRVVERVNDHIIKVVFK